MTAKIIVRPGRSPFQFALVAVSATAGLVGLILPGPGPSNNIPRVFGGAAPWFYVAMLAASLIVFAGMVAPRSSSGRFQLALEVERIGLWPLAGATLAYAATNLAVSGQSALISALLTAGIGFASIARIWIITVDLRRINDLFALDATRKGPGRGEPSRGEPR